MVVDREDLLRRVDGDLELLAELLDIFVEDLPGRLEELRASLEAADLECLGGAAHAIKGSTGNLAGTRAHEAAKRLETMARDGQRDGLEQAVAELEERLGALVPALRQVIASGGAAEG